MITFENEKVLMVHSMLFDFPSQDEDSSFRSRQTHYERAWIFRKWYDFDVKYPFIKCLG